MAGLKVYFVFNPEGKPYCPHYRRTAVYRMKASAISACPNIPGYSVREFDLSSFAGVVVHESAPSVAESRIDIIGQNGNDGLHYEEDKHDW